MGGNGRFPTSQEIRMNFNSESEAGQPDPSNEGDRGESVARDTPARFDQMAGWVEYRAFVSLDVLHEALAYDECGRPIDGLCEDTLVKVLGYANSLTPLKDHEAQPATL
jgi:hypothetical protein